MNNSSSSANRVRGTVEESTVEVGRSDGMEQLQQQSDNNGNTITIKLDECLHYLDRRILALSWYELRELFVHLHYIAESGQSIRDLVAECRVNGINITTPQQQKINKICDFVIENVSVISIYHPICSEVELQQWSIPTNLTISSYLPNRSYLFNYQYKMRMKLKTLEEMLLSKRLESCKFRFSGKMSLMNRLQNHKVFDLHMLKSEVSHLFDLLDDLAFYFDKYDGLFQYFDAVKEYIHKPWQHIIVQASDLPNIEEIQARIGEESQNFKVLEESYNKTRSHQSLVAVAILKSQLSQIEDMAISTVMNNLPVAQMIQSLEKISTHCNQANNIQKLSTDQEETILALLDSQKSNMVEILRQRTTQQVEEAFRKYASCLVETFKYQPKGDGITVAEICDRPEQAWICKVESFNWGRYFGIIESWHQKHRLLEEKTQESTFIDAYQSLQSARNSYRKCGKSFEKSLQEFYSHLKKHDRVMMLVKEFKLRINKIVEKELCQNISIK